MLVLTVLKTVIDISVNVEKPTEYETFSVSISILCQK